MWRRCTNKISKRKMKKKKKKWNSGTIESPTDDASLQPQLFMPTYFHHTLCVFWYRCGCFALDCNSRDYSFSRTDQRKSNQFISEFLYIMSSGRFFLSLSLFFFSFGGVHLCDCCVPSLKRKSSSRSEQCKFCMGESERMMMIWDEEWIQPKGNPA